MTLRPWLLVMLVLAVIVYGSLYPFSFHTHSTGPGAIQHFLSTWQQRPQSRGDLLANLALYAPLGACLAVASQGWLTSSTRIVLLATLAGAILSAAMEILQYSDAGRVSSMSDFYLNATGTLVGAIFGVIWRRSILAWDPLSVPTPAFPLILILAFIAWRLFPYEPVIDMHKYWASLKPVVLTPSIDGYDVFRYAVMWSVVAYVVQFGLRWHYAERLVPLFFALIFSAKIAIIGLVLTPSEIVGAGVALLFFYLFLRAYQKAATRLLAGLLLAAIVLERVVPFDLSAKARTFEWIPFYSFLHGSLAINFLSFLQKVFLYGSGLLLLNDAGLVLWLACGLECGLLLATSLVETHLVARSADISDAMIALLLGIVLYATKTPPASWLGASKATSA